MGIVHNRNGNYMCKITNNTRGGGGNRYELTEFFGTFL